MVIHSAQALLRRRSCPRIGTTVKSKKKYGFGAGTSRECEQPGFSTAREAVEPHQRLSTTGVQQRRTTHHTRAIVRMARSSSGDGDERSATERRSCHVSCTTSNTELPHPEHRTCSGIDTEDRLVPTPNPDTSSGPTSGKREVAMNSSSATAKASRSASLTTSSSASRLLPSPAAIPALASPPKGFLRRPAARARSPEALLGIEG